MSVLVLALVLVAACGGDRAGTTPSTTERETTTASVAVTPTTPVPAVAADQAYAPASDAQRLDLYEPPGGSRPYPLVVIIHGGGWTVGDKRGELPSAAIPGFLDLGYAVASINYRLAPAAVFPAQLIDVKAAIRYLRARADVYGLDPDRFAVVGESAGAHLALLLATTADVGTFDDPAFGNVGVSSAVQAVVDFYGPSDLSTADSQRALNPLCPDDPDPNIAALLGASPGDAPALAATASPVTYLHSGQDLPPVFIAHGDADCVVPYQQSIALHDAIEAVAPGRSQLSIVPGSGHYLDFDYESQSQALAAFLAATIGAG